MPSTITATLSSLTTCALGLVAGCATLGPTPSTTAISPVEAGRTSVELTAGGVPGYYLSATTVEHPKGSPIGQLAAVIEPGPALGIPGLFVGGRAVGPGHDIQAEPMLGYRRSFGAARDVSALVVVHGTHASATDGGAHYQATRGGLEVAADLRLLDESRWLEPHLFGSVSVAGISAEGDYCVDATGRYGVDCPTMPGETADRVSAEVSGLYPAATAGVAVHGLAHRDSWFHGARAAAMVSGGAMPRVVGGEQTGAHRFFSLGVVLTLAVGSEE